jgi:phospholipase C
MNSRGLLPLLLAAALFSAPAAHAVDCSRNAGSRPDPTLPAGTPNPDIPIEHIVVIMQENHSFDNYLGKLNQNGYEGQVDGLTDDLVNIDSEGVAQHPFHLNAYCVRDLDHEWDASHEQWDNGKNDGFATTNDDPKKQDGYRAMGYYDETDLPFIYDLANNFAISDRFFSALLGPTYPNRFYALAATSFGHVRNTLPTPFTGNNIPTIFDTLNRYHISWKYYYTDIPALFLFQPTYWANLKHIKPVGEFKRDAEKGRLPQVAFVEQSIITGDEHPPVNFQIAQRPMSERVIDLMHSRQWKDAALFLSYDEHGGYYDHVSPPEACEPDDAPMIFTNGEKFTSARFDRYGMRVPFVMVSPYAKRHYVSHVTYDHTSILKFIETKFNLPALTRRDANADSMLDLFDFGRPNYSVPDIQPQTINWNKFWGCFTKKGSELRYPPPASSILD